MSCEQNSWRICKIGSSLQLMLKSHNWGPESSCWCGNFLFQVVLNDLCDKRSTYLVYRLILRRRLQKGVQENHLPLAAIGGNATKAPLAYLSKLKL